MTALTADPTDLSLVTVPVDQAAPSWVERVEPFPVPNPQPGDIVGRWVRSVPAPVARRSEVVVTVEQVLRYVDGQQVTLSAPGVELPDWRADLTAQEARDVGHAVFAAAKVCEQADRDAWEIAARAVRS